MSQMCLYIISPNFWYSNNLTLGDNFIVAFQVTKTRNLRKQLED